VAGIAVGKQKKRDMSSQDEIEAAENCLDEVQENMVLDEDD
jgi:hypothetical protein